MAHHQDGFAIARGIAHAPAILHRRCHRLLDQDVLAGGEPGERRLGVVVPGCHDGERIDLRVQGELPIVRAGAGDTMLARHLRETVFRPVAKRGELKLRMVGDGPAMHRPEPADPDDSDT